MRSMNGADPAINGCCRRLPIAIAWPVIDPPPRSPKSSPGGRLEGWVAEYGVLAGAAGFVTLAGAIAAAGNQLGLHPGALYLVFVVFPILFNTASLATIQRSKRRR